MFFFRPRCVFFFFFFFSSRRRHTRCSRDWSSDVCSSDLVLYLVVRYARLNLNQRAVLSVGLDVAPDAKDERRRFRSRGLNRPDGPVSVRGRRGFALRRRRGDRRRSNVLANPPFLRNAHLEIGTGAGAIAVRIESHLVGGSTLVGHDELRKIARYAQAIGFHLFHCPGPAITRFRLQQGKRQGRRLWIYCLCCY